MHWYTSYLKANQLKCLIIIFNYELFFILQKSKVTKKKRLLQPWKEEQKTLVLKYFKQHIKDKIPPKKGECLQLKDSYPELLINKSWEKIKIFVVNQYTKM